MLNQLSGKPNDMIRAGYWGNSLVRNSGQLLQQRSLSMPAWPSAHLFHKTEREVENDLAIGGMRKPLRSLGKVPGHWVVGQDIRGRIDNFLNQAPYVEHLCLNALGSEDPQAGPTEPQLQPLLGDICQALGVDLASDGFTEHSKTSLRQPLWTAWATQAKDPDVAATEWLRDGAPSGILHHPPFTGIFPPLAGDGQALDPQVTADELHTDFDTFSNYAEVEEDQEVATEIERLVNEGYIARFASLEACRDFLKSDPVLSKLGVILKIRFDKIKRRLILDCKRSHVNAGSVQVERIILPIVTDAIEDALSLLHLADDGEDVEWMVLDFVDAFWLIPLLTVEQRFYVARYRGQYLVFLRVVQGSRNGPQVWGRIAALTGRMSQSLFSSDELRLQIYVDDPCAAIKGRPAQRRRLKAVLIVFWLLLGFKLSFQKASHGQRVTWIGAALTVHSRNVVFGTVKPEAIASIRSMLEAFRDKNVIPTKTLQSFAGQVNHIANLIWVWRPFLSELWAALASRSSPASGRAPPQCIWKRQILHTLAWIQAFLHDSSGRLVRPFYVESYFGTGVLIEILFDASPWGMGAVLAVSGRYVAYFAAPLTYDDELFFKHSIGDARGQQTWEALAILVGMRHWRRWWSNARARLTIRSDNVSALVLLLKVQAKGRGQQIIARELALEMGACMFRPHAVAHIAGSDNTLADALSRKFQPGYEFCLPHALIRAQEEHVQLHRDRRYYKSSAEGDFFHVTDWL